MKRLVSVLMVLILVAMQFPLTSVKAGSGSVAWDGMIADSYEGGNGSEEEPFLISNGGQLARLAQEVNEGKESNYNYKLTKHINLSSRNWVPIGNTEHPFKGNFNGNGKTITNMKVGYIDKSIRNFRNETKIIDNEIRSQGKEVLYDPVTEALEQEVMSINEELERIIAEEAEMTKEAEITEETNEIDKTEPKEDINVASSEDSSNIRAVMDETINEVESNITNQSESQRSYSLFDVQNTGYEGDAGLFGYFDSGKIEKLAVLESEIIGQKNAGGIVGYCGVNATIDNCEFTGVVNNSLIGYIGGIVGYSDGRVSNCINSGSIGSITSPSAYIGGIVGQTSNFITNSENSGPILGNASFIGGIAGKVVGGKMITYCLNTGNIGSPEMVGTLAGGIVGRAPEGYVNKSANQGTVTTSSNDSDSFIGGLAGNSYIVTTSYNTGDVSGYWASGLSGVLTGGSLKNYNAGQIRGDRNASITCLLESMGTVGRNSTYWRSGSATYAIRTDAAYPYGGTPVSVALEVMQNPNWGESTLNSPFISDGYLVNDRYPVLEGINYSGILPQGPSDAKPKIFNYGGFRSEDSPEIKNDYPQTCYYSDSYFGQRASRYNPSLATMSMCLVMSGFNSNADASTITSDENSKYTEKYKNAEKLLKDIGFTAIEANDDYKKKPTENSFGVITGHKELTIDGKKTTLIALIGRGGGYELEWSGNFMVGENGEHQGFTEGRDKAYSWLANYINQHREDTTFHENDVQFWITGYSRAAAVTNLLAGKMTTDLSIEGIEYSNEDLYAYCLAPPMGAIENVSEVENRSYANIHNIVNPNDFVPKVAPAAWSFNRYGIDKRVIPDRLMTSNGEDFKTMYDKLKNLNTDWSKELIDNRTDSYLLNDFQGKKLTIGPAENPETGENFLVKNKDIAMSQSLDNTMNLVAKNIGDRKTYVTKYQATISELGGQALGNPKEVERWSKTVPKHINKAIEENLLQMTSILLGPSTKPNELKIVEASDLIIDITLESLTKEGIHISRELLSDTVGLVLRTGLNSLLTSGGSDMLTFFSNMNLMVLPHYPELYFAWLQAHDPNYGGTSTTYVNAYRIASISGDADVSVYDKSGVLVAQITGDEPEKIEDSTIIASINEGNEKNIYLPTDSTYDIKVDAKGEGKLNYAIREFDGDTSSYAKMVNYYDIPVTAGERLEGVVPRFSNEDVVNIKDGSNVSYMLETSGSTLTPSLEEKGEAAREALYDVTVVSNMEDKGLAFGTGIYCEGSIVQVVALPLEGKRFTGWYQDNELISTDARYEFMVTQDVNLKAIFE